MSLHNFFFLLAVAAVSSAQFIPSSGPVYINPNAAAAPSFDVSEAPAGDRTTQTVYGFLDFTTTIGNTVMVFSPQSAAVEKKTEKPTTQKPVIETKAPTAPPPEIQPSKTTKPEPESKVEVKKEEPKKSTAAIFSVVEVKGGDVKPTKVQEQPLVISSKVEVKEGAPVKIKKSSKPPVTKVEVRDEKNQIISSKVEIKTEPSKVPFILSSKVEVVTNNQPIISSKVEVLSNEKPVSSVVQVLTSEPEEPAVEVDANNIDKPEYDFLNRQPSAIVDENYRVIDLKPNSKQKTKPRLPSNAGRATGLVSKMGGTVVKDGVTTVHETEVIGTYINGKYAQVLQSTARVIPKAPKINPTQTARILKTAAPSIPKNRVQLEPTPAGSLHEETALPLEALFHGDKNHIRPSRRPGPAVGGPSGKNEVKGKYRSRASKETQETLEEDDEVEEYNNKRKFRPSSTIKPSFRFGKSSGLSQVPTVSVYSESTVTPSGRKYQNSGRRQNSGENNNFKGKTSHEKVESGNRRTYKPKVQPSSPENAGGSTSLYKFKLQRPSGRWQYKTTPKPRITIRGRQNDEQNEVATSPSTPPLVGSEDDAERREDVSGDETPVEPSVTASTIKVSISTPPDFSDTYYEIATVKSPYIFQAGTVKNTRYITVTTTIEKTLQSIEPTLPVLSPTLTEPLTENILASTAPVYEKENSLPLDSSIATLPPIALGTDVETPPLETLTETFSTTQTLLKTHILPVIRGGSDTTSYTLVQSYHVTRLVTATKTLPPMEVYQFVPSKTLKEFNSRLEEAGSELHLELDFGDEGNQEDDEDNPPGIRAFPPDLDLANIGNDFDVSSVDATQLAEALRKAKLLRKATTPKPTTEAPSTTPALPPEQLQQLALLRLLNPNANIPQLPQLLTSSKPVIKLETIFESHVIPIINGASTSFSTLSRPVATISKTEYEPITSTITPPLPSINPLNPLFPPQFTITSTPVVTNTIVTATESKILKLTFGAKTAYTTLYSTRVVPTLLTTYLTSNVPVVPTAAPFPGFFPGAFPGFPGFG